LRDRELSRLQRTGETPQFDIVRPMRLLFAGLAATALVLAQPSDVRTDTLSNGLKILVQEDHNIPNVAMYFFYKIGSRNEHPGATGLSHFFEHMMFNGAKKYGAGQFDFQMEKNGGNNNAYTTTDDTVYTDWFPRTALELMIDMEADRIRDLTFDPKIIESERGVVYSERRSSVDNSNFGILFEQLHAAAYTAHPYHWPVVGWPSDIESWTMDDLKSHFRMGYAPNNCVMVVVGDVSSPEVISLAKKYLEPIPRQAPPPPVRTKEPDQIGERRVTVVKPAQLPIEMVAYHVPEANHPDDAVLDVLETILSRGQSSRLYSRMVDKDQLVLSINVFRQTTFDPGLLVFSMQPRSGIEPARAEKVLFEELSRVSSQAVPDQELRNAKNQLLAGHYRELKTIAGRANLLGQYEVFYGDYRKLYSVEQKLEAVTAADIQRVARQYLTEKNRTVATLIPEAWTKEKQQ
jgi:zinc protease